MTPSIRYRTGRRLRYGAAFAAVFLTAPLLAGCVSAVEDTSAFGFSKTNPQAANAAADAAGEPTNTEAHVAEAGSDTPKNAAETPEAAKTVRIASADKERTPDEGATKAVADEARFGRPETKGAPVATGAAAIAAFAGSSVLSSSQTGQPEQTEPRRGADSTMFASLYAQSRAKTPIRNVDLGKTRRVILAREGAPADAEGGSALPGVRGASSLFEIGQRASADYDADIIDEANGEEGTFQTASIGGLARLAPNGLTVQRPDVQTSCFQPDLVSMIRAIESRFGAKVLVTSGYRSPTHNVRVRGAKRSMHLQCKAADIVVPGANKFTVAAFVRALPKRGGVGTYCNTNAIHIDTGTQRDWNWACRRAPSKGGSLLLASQKSAPRSSDD